MPKYLILSALFVFSLNAFSKPAGNVEELFKVMKMQELQNKSITAIVDQQMSMSPGMAKYKVEYTKLLQKYVGWKALKKPVGDMWAGMFTEKEIKDLVKFYKTSTGQKLLNKQPVIAGEITKITQEILSSKSFQNDAKSIFSSKKKK